MSTRRKVEDWQIVEDWKKTPSIAFLAGRYGMTQRQLARRVGGLRAAGANLESPDSRSPHFSSVEKKKQGELVRSHTKILLLDIETAPNLAYVWGTWKQNINPEWISANGYVLCWTAKWLGEKEVFFQRLHKGKPISLLEPIRSLLNEAHAVVHYNGQKFDIPTLNKEFLTHNIRPPSPYKQIDLLKTMWGSFLFPNNKLDYIVKTLGLGAKERHKGAQLWLDCMADDPEAWKQMESYNKKDVEILENLYHRLLPWIKGHPNRAAFVEDLVCPACESTNFKRDGTYNAQILKYPRFQCADCGSWFKGTKTISHRTKDGRHAPVT
jgi:hypothetical protein